MKYRNKETGEVVEFWEAALKSIIIDLKNGTMKKEDINKRFEEIEEEDGKTESSN